ncbi:MAG TPA: hypothetical protein VNV65_04910 [Candidatus Solibacter sp.]|nr:hypothetical protein [Candidatus Solibacter sp.]
MITIPDCLWAAMLDALAASPPGVERVAYLDGVGSLGDGVVTTVTIPDADLHPGWYDVSAEAISEAGRHLREHGLTRLVQVHTHGGAGRVHSGRDDEMAYSRRPGALSVVLPHHASRRPAPLEGTVHLRREAEWSVLDVDVAAEHLRIVPAHLSFARKSWNEFQTDMPATSAAVSTPWPRRVVRWLGSTLRGRSRA